MDNKDYYRKASEYLQRLCSVYPNRRTGSDGNREATDFFSKVVKHLGYEAEVEPFKCLDYKTEKVHLSNKEKSFDVFNSPYSPKCKIRSKLEVVSTVKELEEISCKGKILLMIGEICEEQLMPKNFVFYNPDHHKKIYALLEGKEPSAIITATSEQPEQVGALYPFPLIIDGDFDIPSLYCTDIVGKEIVKKSNEEYELIIQAERIPSSAYNVIVRINQESREKIIVCAHIDAYEDTPGASDNASGTVVLLLLAELLQDYEKSTGIELIAFNGEDHYSAGGQMDYLKRYDSDLDKARLIINVDDVGYKEGKSAYSFYACDTELQEKLSSAFNKYSGLTEGEPWVSGDHMIFVQKGRSALAFTAEKMPELMKTITHTEKDTPDIINPAKLVNLARALNDVIRVL